MTGWIAPSKGGYQGIATDGPTKRTPPKNPASSSDPRMGHPGEIVFSENVQAGRYTALLEKLNTPRHEQAMSDATFDEICRRAWEALPRMGSWADAAEHRDQFATDVRNALTAGADLMPIETLHGADGASVWLRGEG